MRGAYTLKDGREIVLRELHQWHTHEGVLEGRPSPEMNGHQLTGLVGRYKREGAGASLFLGDLDVGPSSDAFPFGTPATLPHVTCAARFVSFSPTKKSDLMRSELTLLWFQNEFWRQPTSDSAIASIDWERDAWDYDI